MKKQFQCDTKTGKYIVGVQAICNLAKRHNKKGVAMGMIKITCDQDGRDCNDRKKCPFGCWK